MYRKIFSIVLIIFLGSKNIQAQDAAPSSSSTVAAFDNFFTFDWEISMPMGDKFADATSLAGANMEFRKMVRQNLSVGLSLSWNSYYEYKAYQPYHVNASTDVTTDLYKYNYTLPMALTVHHYFSNNGGIFQAYAGLGLGAVYATPRLYFNIYEIAPENWGFLVRPELGAMIKFDRNADVGALIGVRYSYSTNSEEQFNIDNMQALSFTIGIAWTY
jgi:hypothetical protein